MNIIYLNCGKFELDRTKPIIAGKGIASQVFRQNFIARLRPHSNAN